ncbi:MAG: hypothetical protein CL910_07590 [Deltaproteobacteria bacterium]|nr:hypothetical protein [Deltaproteobacteria bacterium]
MAVEVLIEARRGGSPELHLDAAALHLRIDLLVEVPALLLVACTGIAMLMSSTLTALLVLKLFFAAVAVASNAGCVWIVFKRRQAMKIGIEAVEAESARMDRMSLPLLGSWLITLSIGTYLLLGS